MISKRIKELRTEKDVTQRELANYLSLTPKMISFYENGERFPPHDIIIKISEYFNVSTDYLLGKTNIKKNIEQIKEEFENSEERIIIPESFENAEEALKFILDQPVLMAYGGYDLKKMSEEEILEIAENMLFSLRLSLEKRKKKKGE